MNEKDKEWYRRMKIHYQQDVGSDDELDPATKKLIDEQNKYLRSMKDKDKFQLKTQEYYVSYTVGKLQEIIDWFEDGTNDWDHTIRLYGIELNYTLLKLKEKTLNKKNYNRLENEYNVCHSILMELKTKKVFNEILIELKKK